MEDPPSIDRSPPPNQAAPSSPTSSSSPPQPPAAPPPPPPPPPAASPPLPFATESPALSLVQPSQKRRHRPSKVLRAFRSAFRSLPIITPACKFPQLPSGALSSASSDHHHHHHHAHHRHSSGSRITGTLYGYRKGRVTLSVQENPRTLPTAVVELAMLTNSLQKEMSLGMVRMALECEKRPEKDRTKLLEEPMWTMYCNGRKTGYGVRREASPEDLGVMELLKAVSMGAGVLPANPTAAEGADAELAYMRAYFERVVGSRDSETLYMMSPEGNHGPELSIFFVRI